MFHLFAKPETETGKIKRIIEKAADSGLTDEEFILREIRRFKNSKARQVMLEGERYYRGEHDILKRKRQIINDEGVLETVENLPNNRIVDNQYAIMVAQKKSYLLSKPFTLKTENKEYAKLLKWYLDKCFKRLMKNIGQDSLNCGIGWLHVGYDETGELGFKRFRPYETIPGWRDAEHTKLDYLIRVYERIVCEKKLDRTIEKVEVYTLRGVYFYTLVGGKLIPDPVPHQHYFYYDGVGYNWEKIPVLPFKCNSDEIPLITRVKSIQDGINLMLSTFENNMEEDPRNSILVVINYSGTSTSTLRKNLATTGVVFVDSEEGQPGDVKTLSVEVNAENYRLVVEIFKKALIENAMGYDAKDDRIGGTPNEMNLLSMYSNIDLDTDDMEAEYQASIDELLWFLDAHFYNSGRGDFSQEEVQFIFNRAMLMLKAQAIQNCRDSVGILSNRTILANHPMVDDPDEEEAQILKEQEAMYANPYRMTFGGQNPADKNVALKGGDPNGDAE